MCDHCHSFTRLGTTYAISFLLSLSTFCPPNNSSPQLLQDSCHLISQCSPLPQDFSAPQPAIYRANSSCVRLRRNSSYHLCWVADDEVVPTEGGQDATHNGLPPPGGALNRDFSGTATTRANKCLLTSH